MTRKFLKYTNDLDIRLNNWLFSDTIIGEYTGEVIPMEECYERWNEMEQSTTNYLFHTCCKNMALDASAMGHHTRFINHDCGDAELQFSKSFHWRGSEDLYHQHSPYWSGRATLHLVRKRLFKKKSIVHMNRKISLREISKNRHNIIWVITLQINTI